MKKLFVVMFVAALAILVSCTGEQAKNTEETAEVVAADANAAAVEAPAAEDAFKAAKSDFHEVLAPLWHEAYEDKNIAMINENIDAAIEKAEALVEASVGQGEEVEAQAKVLMEAAKAVRMAIDAEETEENILTAVEAMHEAYHALQEL